MINAIKEFWTDYGKLWNETYKWFRKHWKGYLVIMAMITTICTLIVWMDMKRFEIKSKKILEDYNKELEKEFEEDLLK